MGTYPARPPDALTVTIDRVPDACLAPNARRTASHWRGQHEASAALRQWTIGRVAHQTAGIDGWPIFADPVSIAYLVRWPKGRRRVDVDALPTMCKAILDGLTDVGIIAGDGPDQVVEVSARQEKTPGDGETVVTIRRMS